VVTVDKLSQATVADEEWAVTESAFTGECTPVVDTARDFSDHIASPWSANVFEYATKSLSMDSITVVSEPVAVQRENDVKEGNEPEAALGKIMHSPLTIRKLRRAVAEENEADDVPLCIFISSSGGEENSAEPVLVEREKEVNEPEAALAKIAHSPLTIRKLRRAVAEEIEADDVPLCIFTSSGDENTAEPVLVEPEKEVNEPKAALAKIAHSPLTIRKLRRAVAEENEADDVRLCIFTSSSGGEENSAEPVLAEREKEVNEHEALSSLSLRKLRTEFNQIVAVAQENEVKEGEKSSQALDKLSLRKLRTKLKETLNAHKVTTDEQHFTSTCVLFTV
jgi:nanoRNase/pAp phosphatase (c-di-AMP/oligoRNAs hydrolase)